MRINLPYTFQVGQTTDADKIMANYNTISGVVNGNLDGQNFSSSAELTVNTLNAEIETEYWQGTEHIVVKLPSDDGTHSCYIKDNSNNTLIEVKSNGQVNFTNKYVSGMLAIGTILMYNGTGIANIATRSEEIGDNSSDTISLPGWKVCNGIDGTPNLIDRFIVGGTSSGETGGSNDAVVVEHTHTITIDNTTDTHYHGVSSYDYFVTGTGTEKHRHKIYGYNNSGSYDILGYNTVNSTSHSHNVNAEDSRHYHVWTGNTDTVGHTHSITLSSTGEDVTGKNMPPYYSVIFIIKVR